MTDRKNILLSAVVIALCLFADTSPGRSATQDLDFGTEGVMRIDIPDAFVWNRTVPEVAYIYRSQSTGDDNLAVYFTATKPPELFDMPDDEYLERLHESSYPDGLPSGFVVENHLGNRPAIVVIADVAYAAESMEYPVQLSGWAMWITMMYYDKAFTVMVSVPDDPEGTRDRFLDIMWNAEHWIVQ